MQGPDGQLLEFPDGTQPDVMKAAMRKRYGGPSDAPTLDEINAQNRAARAAPGYAGEQARVDAENHRRAIARLPMPLRALMGVGTAIAEPLVGASQITGIGSKDWQDRQIANIEATKGNTAGNAGSVVGNIAAFALPMTKVGMLPKAGQYLASAGIGAAAGGLDPVTGDESRAKNIALGGLFGLGGQATGDVLQATGKMAAANVSQEAKAVYQAAKARGINLTPTQLSDSRFMGWMRGQLGALPGSGAPAQARKQAQQFNAAVSKTVGESDPMSREVFDQALTRIGGQFDRFTGNNIPVSNGFMAKVLQVQDEAAGLADGDTARNMKYIADRIFKQGTTGTLPGKAVQSIDSDLSGLMRQGGERAIYAGRMREALHDQIGKTIGPNEKAAWDEARGQYANAMKIMGLVGKNDGVPAAQLMGALTNNGAGKRAMARDRAGELGQLAKIGQRMKGAPSSGTAERLQSAGLGAAFIANPLGTLAGLTGGRVARGLSDSDILAQALLNRGAGRQAIAPYARGAGLGVMRYSPDDNTGNGP